MASTAERVCEDPARFEPAPAEQRVLLQHAAWADYQRLDELRGESAVPRLTFLHGSLELMTPGLPHETDKTRLGRLIEAWADLTGVELTGAGSWTLKDEAKALGAEADECYLVGPLHDEPQRPDIAIEVVKTSGGIDKLAVYRGLGVPEVWLWQSGRLSIHLLTADGYQEAERSARLAGLDPTLIAECMAAPSQTAAVRLLRERLAP
ncbi:MAG: Uma2 family endonuclease [Gammaproteobacteria bacterium]|jgi:Uma2 family endonuclease|nr:Uma2 family endonuclease [Gammaproteobacteria bacterium]